MSRYVGASRAKSDEKIEYIDIYDKPDFALKVLKLLRMGKNIKSNTGTPIRLKTNVRCFTFDEVEGVGDIG